GSVEGDGPEVFSQVIGVEADGLGRIYVLDRQIQEVRVFQEDGSYVRTLGRKGEGPGEFRGADGLGWGPQGRLWVVDQRLHRFSVYDTSGNYVTSYRAPMRIRQWEWSGSLTASGELYDFSLVGSGDESRPVVLLFDTVGQYPDTFALPHHETEFFKYDIGSSSGMTEVPFSPKLTWLVGPSGALWSGVADRYRIYRSTLEGDTLRAIEREYDPVEVSSGEREAAEARVRDFVKSKEIDLSRIPRYKPAFQRFTVDEAGVLWVRVSDSAERAGSGLDVFDPDGRYLGQVRTRSRISQWPLFRVRGGNVYFVTTDEFDVPFVVRARIEGRAGGAAPIR
ncbi:MAG: 6-bladed beta-propeller, partial [Gemmatimonadales bacterium]